MTPQGMAGAGAAAAGLGIALYFGYHLFFLFSPPFLVVSNPKHDIITSDTSIPLSGITQKESRVFVNEREIPAGPDGAFSDALLLQEGMNIIEITAVNKFRKETVIVRRIIKQ